MRSSYFLGGGPGVLGDDGALGGGRVGILVCAKNSSPLTPTVRYATSNSVPVRTSSVSALTFIPSHVALPPLPCVVARSAASAGALEFMTIYSTSNLPKMLKGAQEDGWRILGAAAEVPEAAREYRSGARSGAVAAGTAVDNEWDVDGAAVEVAVGDETVGAQTPQARQCLGLHEVDTTAPTILVLGSEGTSSSF